MKNHIKKNNLSVSGFFTNIKETFHDLVTCESATLSLSDIYKNRYRSKKENKDYTLSAKEYKDSEPYDEIMGVVTQDNKTPNNIDKIWVDYNQHKFEHNLLYIKGGLIIFMILITCVYTFLYNSTKTAWTYIHDTSTLHKVGLDALVAGLFGILSFAVLVLSRTGSISYLLSKKQLTTIIIIFCVLALFNIAQETSGLNRALDMSDILEGKSPYYDLYIKNGVTNEELALLSAPPHPFYESISYLFIIIILLLILIGSFNIIKYTLCNAKYFPINNINKLFGFKQTNNSSKYILFALEVLLIVTINFIPVIISPIIRGESKKISIKGFSTYFMLGVIFVLQFMFQYIGFTPEANYKQISNETLDNIKKSVDNELKGTSGGASIPLESIPSESIPSESIPSESIPVYNSPIQQKETTINNSVIQKETTITNSPIQKETNNSPMSTK